MPPFISTTIDYINSCYDSENDSVKSDADEIYSFGKNII